MSLLLHLFIHFASSLVAGFLAWFFLGEPLFALLGAILGGFFIDIDHLIDYFLAFGAKFKMKHFLKGDQFLKSDKIYVLFHGWEYGILLLIVSLGAQLQAPAGVFIFALGLGGLFHLVADTAINHGMSFKAYSIVYRAVNSFKIQNIVTPEHYQEHIQRKQMTDFE